MNFEDIYGLNFRCLAQDFCWQRDVVSTSLPRCRAIRESEINP